MTRFLMLALLSAGCLGGTVPAQFDQAEEPALQRARRILREAPLIDGHNDLPWTIRTNPEAPGDLEAFDLRRKAPGDTDLVRLRQGQVGAQFWSVWVPGHLKVGYGKTQLEQIELTLRMIERYPEDLVLALTAADIEKAFSQGRIASLLGMEGGYGIENSLGALRAYYRLGVRYMTLAHNVTLDWVDSAMDTPRHGGLTDFGKEVVGEMNRLGMLVDLSHVTPLVMQDALDVSQAPLIFSHSAARALTDHPRNVPDSILQQLPSNGGVIMVTFIPPFVSQQVADWQRPLQKRLAGIASSQEYDRIRQEYSAQNPAPQASLSQVADHIEHVRKVSGNDHVGIGSDFWGSPDMPVGLEDTSRFPYLFAELIRRGWSDSDLKKLAGGNFLRVLKKAEEVAQRLQKSRPPSNATTDRE
ncbi:MAG: dipeptidase [Acidobacteriota bacterium]